MNIREFKDALRQNPEKQLCFILPGGDTIPAAFHITEVGHVTKHFVDCGGTKRTASACVLQAWVSEGDPEHRLSAGRLGSILELAGKVIPSEELDVEVEYEGCCISQYSVVGKVEGGSALTFALEGKHTDCLAREACGLESCGCDTDKGGCC